jgi:hypothetical protein
MTMLVLSTLLIGGALGMRFKVLILIPAIGLAFIANLAAGFAFSDSVSATLLTAVLASVCLQIGYLCGAMARSGTARARPQNPHEPTLRTKSVH